MTISSTCPSFTDVRRSILDNLRLDANKAHRAIRTTLQSFIDGNSNPDMSPNFRSGKADDMETVVSVLSHPAVLSDPTFTLLALTVLKILSRKRCNRLKVTSATVGALIVHLSKPVSSLTAAEAANVLLNICYEQPNVELVLQQGAAAVLVPLLQDTNSDLQANVAGALQSICFQKAGRAAVRGTEAAAQLCALLNTGNPRVTMRAAGALHNVSTDADAIRCIRRCNGIPKLVRLLRSDETAVAASAAGALQNIAREVASRLILCDTDCPAALAALVASGDAQAQVCAAGALLNVLGPQVSRGGDEQRLGMCRMLSMTMALAGVYAGCFGEAPSQLRLA